MKKCKKDGFDTIDEASEETFPTSDAPAWTLGLTDDPSLGGGYVQCEPARILLREHELVRKVIATVGEFVELIGAGKIIHWDDLKCLNEFLLHFLDHCHYKKEEILFPLLVHGEQHPSEYMLKDLTHEHHAGHDLLERLEARINDYKTNAEIAEPSLIAVLTEIQHFHINHISEEETYILPFIEKIVDAVQQKKLVTQFKLIDQHLDKLTLDFMRDFLDKYDKRNRSGN